MSRFVIIGAGISGCTAGYELAEMGHDVEIIESGSEIGGKVLTYCCKATEECSRCGVCIAHTKLDQALKHERIDFSVGAKIQSVAEKEEQISIEITSLNPTIDHKKCIDCGACIEACPENCISRFNRAELVQYTIDYSRCLIRKGEKCTACANACSAGAISCGKGSKEEKKKITADGVLIATGHDPFDAVQKVRYGYTRLNNIITGAEAEEILSKQAYLGDPADSIAFIQCVGSRDPQIGRNYCSGVCCSYALRLARIINHRSPEADVTIYYIDIQNFDKTFTVLREELESSNIHFVRGVPFSVEQLANGKLKLLIESVNGKDSAALHDMVVLSVGLGPASGSERIADLFKLEQDEFGFFRRNRNGHENIFVCGTCKEPQSIPESMASARAAAVEMNKSRNPGLAYGADIKTTAKTSKAIKASKAISSIPVFEMKTLPLEKSVLVIGGGPAGLYTAAETQLLGYKTIVIEKSGKTGGQYSADDLPGLNGTVCTACTSYTKSVLTELKGHLGSFTARITTPSGQKEIHCGAIVLASGSQHGDNGKTEVHNNSSIVPLSELKKACAALPRRKKIRSIGIILDLDIDETKASTEAALLIAKELQERERLQVYLFCRDMRVAALNLEKLYDQARDRGVNIVKYEGKLQLSAGAGASAETGSQKPNPVEIFYMDSILQQDAGAACDLVGISACGISSAADPELAELTAISTDLFGQLQDNNIHLFPEQTNRPGIFVVGACRGQYYLPQIAAEAKAAASAVHTLLKDGSMEVELSNAVVDADKCILCLTCVRSCPHNAMEVDREEGAAVSIPEVCQKCGICAGECPAKAISLPVYSDDVLLSLI